MNRIIRPALFISIIENNSNNVNRWDWETRLTDQLICEAAAWKPRGSHRVFSNSLISSEETKVLLNPHIWWILQMQSNISRETKQTNLKGANQTVFHHTGYCFEPGQSNFNDF